MAVSQTRERGAPKVPASTKLSPIVDKRVVRYMRKTGATRSAALSTLIETGLDLAEDKPADSDLLADLNVERERVRKAKAALK